MNNLPDLLDRIQLPQALPPILLMAFNRPDLLKEVLNGIESQVLIPSTIIAYIDGPPTTYTAEKRAKIKECIELLESFKPVPIQIRTRSTNWGVTKNTLDAITTVLNEYSSVLFIEDDVAPGPYYYRTMTLLLEAYKPIKDVFSVQAFRDSSFFKNEIENSVSDFYATNKFFCWGFGTWSDRWLKIVGKYDQIKLSSLKTAFTIPTYVASIGYIHKFIFSNFYNNPKKDDWTYVISLLCMGKYVHIAPKFSSIRNLGYAHPEAVLTTTDWPEVNEYYLEVELKTLPANLDLIPKMYEPLSKKDAFKYFARLILTKIVISPNMKKIINKLLRR